MLLGPKRNVHIFLSLLLSVKPTGFVCTLRHYTFRKAVVSIRLGGKLSFFRKAWGAWSIFCTGFPLHISGGSHYNIPSTYHWCEKWNFYNLQFVFISLGVRVIKLLPDIQEQLLNICPLSYERIWRGQEKIG